MSQPNPAGSDVRVVRRFDARNAGRPAIAVALLGAVIACRGGGAPSVAGAGGLGSILKPTDEVLLQRVLPEALGDGAIAVVVKTAEGPVELRLAERLKGGGAGGVLTVTHTSRPGDEFRNLTVEDLTGDGTPEIVSSWIGGQLETIEVLGRGKDGGFTALLQNAGQTVETRRRSDHVAAFWITSRTYEEDTGQPPIYQTTIFEWNGSAFAERSGSAATAATPAEPGAQSAVPAMAPRH